MHANIAESSRETSIFLNLVFIPILDLIIGMYVLYFLPKRFVFLAITIFAYLPPSLAAMRQPSTDFSLVADTSYHLVLVRKVNEKPIRNFEAGDEIAIRLKGSLQWISGKLEAVQDEAIVFNGAVINTQAIRLIRPIPSTKAKRIRWIFTAIGLLGYLAGLLIIFLSLPYGTLLLLLGMGIIIIGAMFLILANLISPIYRIGWWFQLLHERD